MKNFNTTSQPETSNKITTHADRVKALKHVFSLEGPLAQYFGDTYQHRPGQVELSTKWLTAATTSTHIVGEGPTGVGKSMGYSIPSILLIKDPSVPHVKRLLIATANIALQEQLYYKDLPILKEVLFPDLTFGLLKGKNNYLCRQKYDDAEESIFRDDDLDSVRAWLQETQTGDKSELKTPLKKWHLFSSTSTDCLGKKCPHRDVCFARMAQAKAKEAEVIVTNFHMLLVAGGGLPSHQLLVCDEGHELASVARSALGFTISRGNLDWAKSQMDKLDLSKEAVMLEDELLAFEEFYFKFIGQKKAGSKRIEFNTEIPDLTKIKLLFDQLKKHLRQERDRLEEEEGNEVEAAKMGRDADRVQTILKNFEILEELDPANVFWAEKKTRRDGGGKERKQRGRRRTSEWINLECRPIDVSPLLRKMFFTPQYKEKVDPDTGKIETSHLPYSVLLVSATMTSNDGFEFIREETGLSSDLGVELSVPSPFNLQEQGTLIVPQTMAHQPKYGGGPEESEFYYEALAEHLKEFTNNCGGRVLALFTSWTAMKETLNRCRSGITVPIFSQDEGERTQLVSHFRKLEAGLLAGVSSFWTGVDIPGMQGLFIDKLPFPVPSDPLFAAMSDLYETRGKKPFFDLSLPLATLKLRQGIGRLIRTEKDKGYAMIADRRLLDKGYGNNVIMALPDFRFIVNVDLM